MDKEKPIFIKHKKHDKRTLEALRSLQGQVPVEEKVRLLVNLRENKYGGKNVYLNAYEVCEGVMASKPIDHKWKCKQCGNCCIWNEAEIMKSEIESLKNHTGRNDFWIKDDRSYTGFRLKHVDGKCIFLDNKRRCSIYNLRPIVCRTYPYIVKEAYMNGRTVQLIQFTYSVIGDNKLICNGFEEGELDHKKWIRQVAKLTELLIKADYLQKNQ